MMGYKINNIYKIFLFTIIITFVFSCTNTLKENLVEFIENNCSFENNIGCELDLNKFVKEKFNHIYIFGESTTSEEISKIIGTKYKGKHISDSEYRIVFLMNHRIIIEEDFEEDLFEFDRNDVKIYQGLVYRFYNTSKFMIVKVGNNKNKLFYILKPRSAKSSEFKQRVLH